MIPAQWRWKIGVFRLHWREYGPWSAIRYAFGRYYTMPVDHEPSAFERSLSEHRFAYRHGSIMHYRDFVQATGNYMSPEHREHIAEVIGLTSIEAREDQLMELWLGDEIPCGFDYDYPEEKTNG